MVTISDSGVVAALRGLQISDDTRYKQTLDVEKERVERAVAGVNTANRNFAVGLLAECIRKETGGSDSDLPEIITKLNAAADSIALARFSQKIDEQQSDVVKRVVDALKSNFGDFYAAGLKEFTKAGNEDRFAAIFSVTLELLKKEGFEYPFATDNELKAAVVDYIKSN